MAEERSLHIDTDWKKQAQAEKRKLAEEQQRQAEAAAAKKDAPAPLAPGLEPAGLGGPAPEPRAGKGAPEGGFAALVQSALTQVLFYLGEISRQGSPPVLNLDMAKFHVNMLNALEEKTVNNLTEEEQRLLDHALYNARTRFISVASQYI